MNLELLESRDCPSLTAILDTDGVLRIWGDSVAHKVRIATVAEEYGGLGIPDNHDLVKIYVDDSSDWIERPSVPGTDTNPRIGSTVKRIEYHTAGPGSWITLDESLGNTPVTVVSRGSSRDRITAESSNVVVFGQKTDWLEGVFVDAPTKKPKK